VFRISFCCIFFMLMLLMVTVGCSSSDDDPAGTTQTVSGVAAAGAPIIGYAYLKDSAGHTLGPKEIAQNGSFSFAVTGLTAPFYLRAEVQSDQPVMIYIPLPQAQEPQTSIP